MIEMIKIKNYVLIKEAEIELGPNLNIITGETGAGKSLFIGALSLILGDKSQSNFIGKHSKEASVEAIIRVDSKLSQKLKKYEISHKESIVVKRIVGERNRSYIDGNVVSQNQLKDIMSDLLDICSQHENQSLIEEKVQREIIDQEIDAELINSVKTSFLNLKELKESVQSLIDDKKNNESKKDYIDFQLEEIKSLKLTKEDEDIEEKVSILKNSAKISSFEKEIKESLFSSIGVKSLLKEVYLNLKEIEQLKNESEESNVSESFKEKMNEFVSYLESLPKTSSVSVDEDMYQYYLNRIEEISKLKRKYGSIKAIFEKKEELENSLDLITNFDEIIEEKKEEIKKSEREFVKLSKKLSEKRKEKAEIYSKKIEQNLKKLNMPFAQFKIEIKDTDYSIHGFDKISFMISPNRSEPISELSKIASGGELSRVILAVRAVSSNSKQCYLFDEVDAGVGGDTALMIGQKLREISEKKQVICITHLPQVAVYADSNYNIEKKQTKESTFSEIYRIESDELVEEISRMLGGSLAETTARANALELIKKTKQK